VSGQPSATCQQTPSFTRNDGAMSITKWAKRRWLWLVIGVPVALVVLVVGGTFVYIHFISPDPAPPLTFPAASSAAASDDPPATLDGTWAATTGSAVQYRVNEVLFGQDNTATGKTDAVTGDVSLTGTTVDTAKFTVDMTAFTSDSGQRDGQFRGRIMETSQFPTATFELTQPIDLQSVPANLQEITVKATGKLTLHGVTKDVTVDLKARLNGSNLEINGTIPVAFADYNIANPSGGPAQVGDNGTIEVLLVLQKS
jgi:polyisoprenoid-binding protein YceI